MPIPPAKMRILPILAKKFLKIALKPSPQWATPHENKRKSKTSRDRSMRHPCPQPAINAPPKKTLKMKKEISHLIYFILVIYPYRVCTDAEIFPSFSCLRMMRKSK